ncbi:MAG: hypothetical protein LLF75_10525 [Eubacteriales bacterium]|nr:hypothetical protein [Eubacteriales bacterium]
MDEKQSDHEKKSAISAAICSVITAVVTITSGAVEIIRDNQLLSILLAAAAIILFVFTSIICFGKREPEDVDRKYRWIKIICMGISLLLIIVLVVCTAQRICNKDSGTINIGIFGCGHEPTSTPAPSPTPVPPIQNPSGKIAAGDDFSLLLKSDKTVATYGAAKAIDTSSWENIIQIAAYKDHAIGLREDKTVVVTGVDRKEYNVSSWSDIVQVAACNGAVIGLRGNGDLEIKGPCSNCLLGCDEWEDVEQIIGAGELVVAVNQAGILTADECKSDSLDYDEYERIVSGAVINYPGQVEKNWMILLLDNGKTRTFRDGGEIEDEVSYWTDMKQVAGGNGFAIGLNKGGFVFKAGNSSEGDLSGISNWSNMIAVCAGTNHVVGLREDGALLAVGYNYSNQCSIEGKNYWSAN